MGDRIHKYTFGGPNGTVKLVLHRRGKHAWMYLEGPGVMGSGTIERKENLRRLGRSILRAIGEPVIDPKE